jgi:hypothetical protein
MAWEENKFSQQKMYADEPMKLRSLHCCISFCLAYFNFDFDFDFDLPGFILDEPFPKKLSTPTSSIA